jgi:hypothetical protein
MNLKEQTLKVLQTSRRARRVAKRFGIASTANTRLKKLARISMSPASASADRGSRRAAASS